MAAPLIISTHYSETSSTGNTLSLTFSESPQENDLILLFTNVDNGTYAADQPSGYEKSVDWEGAYTSGLTVWHRIATGGETGVTISWAGAAKHGQVLAVFVRGVDVDNPINAFSPKTAASGGSAYVTPAVTTTEDDCLIFMFRATQSTNNSSSENAPSDTNLVGDWYVGPSSTLAVVSFVQTTAGDTGTKSWSDVQQGKQVGTIAIAPGFVPTTNVNIDEVVGEDTDVVSAGGTFIVTGSGFTDSTVELEGVECFYTGDDEEIEVDAPLTGLMFGEALLEITPPDGTADSKLIEYRPPTGQNYVTYDGSYVGDRSVWWDEGNNAPIANLQVGVQARFPSTATKVDNPSVTCTIVVQEGNGLITLEDVSENGDYEFPVWIRDITDGEEAEKTVIVDTTGPSGYSISINEEHVHASNEGNIGFTIFGAETGGTYHYSFTDGDSNEVTGSGIVLNPTVSVGGVNLSSLSDGTLTLSVYLKDSLGNPGEPVTATVEKDSTPPQGYSVEWLEDLITESNSTSVGIRISNAEVGSTWHYTITSSGGGTLTDSGEVASTTEDITGINVSSLGDGVLTVSVYLSDEHNAGVVVTDTVSKVVPPEFNTLEIQSIDFSSAVILVNVTKNSTAKVVAVEAGSGQPSEALFNASPFSVNLVAGVNGTVGVTGLTTGVSYDFWVRVTDTGGTSSYDFVNEETEVNLPPTITLLGDSEVSVLKGTTYVDAGATASDPEDGDITANIVVTGSVNTNTAGVYTLQYNVSDSKGLPATPVTRTVTVLETATTGVRERLINRAAQPLVNLTNLTAVIRADLDSTNVLYSGIISTDSNGYITILAQGLGSVGGYVYLTLGTATRERLGTYRVRVKDLVG